MEALEDSNRPSMSDSISLYERYMRSFNVVDAFIDNNNPYPISEPLSSKDNECGRSRCENIDFSIRRHDPVNDPYCDPDTAFLNVGKNQDKPHKNAIIDTVFSSKPLSPCHSNDGEFLSENCSVTGESSCTEKSNPTDAPLSSEDSKSNHSKHPMPVIITSLITMENSNNAVDSVPMFCDVRSSETVFKLPNTELTFNGTLKHVQKMKPIVDPMTVLAHANTNSQVREDAYQDVSVCEASEPSMQSASSEIIKVDSEGDRSTSCTNRTEETSQNTGDSHYQELYPKMCAPEINKEKWTLDASTSSLEASFDSGVRSPDMFSDNDNDDDKDEDSKHFWEFLKDYEAYDKRKVQKMEETLQGVLPPPSVTNLKIDVNEMLKKYYCFLPAFNDNAQGCEVPDVAPSTPTKGLAFIKIPTDTLLPETLQETDENKDRKTIDIDGETSKTCTNDSLQENVITKKSTVESELNTSDAKKKIDLKICSEAEAKETNWPEVLKCRHYDVHYNITKFSERVETLALRCGQRYVGTETDSSVTVFSGGLQSPSSASKRKALRLKMSQAKSPGRRLSHLARRRQTFSAAGPPASRMVLIDKNFFPHRKLINSSDRKSPRVRRTPGKRTPGRKTPGKKTPQTHSGGSSKKKAMRRLLMDSETLTRSQPTRETSKRALFISPENRKAVPQAPTTSVPLQAMKSKRALFGSPVRAETKSLDGTQSDHFLKRKRDMFEDSVDESRTKIAKSLSFGGDSISGGSQPLARRASEVFANRNLADLDEHHRKKLLWAVSEALRAHGWRMQSAGFREKAAALAQLTRRLLALPPHAARLARPHLSTSETFLKIARQYVFAIIQGRSVEECFQEEKTRLGSEEGSHKVSGYISASAYQQLRARQAAAASSQAQVKENAHSRRPCEPRDNGNVLQDKLLNVDSNSSSSGNLLPLLDKTALFKSNSMPSFEEAAKMRARRQISFDNVDFPKR